MFANVCPRNNYLYSPLFGQLGAPLELCSKIWSRCRCQIFVYFWALFRLQSFFTLSSSYQIFEHMYEVLNVDKKITNYIV